MRFFFLALLSLSVFSALQASPHSSFSSSKIFPESPVNADQQIYNCLNSSSFSNSTIYYPYNNTRYPILIINNPNREQLWGGSRLNPISLPLYIVAHLPTDLIRHLKRTVLQGLDDHDDVYFNLKGQADIKNFDSLSPVFIAQRLHDPRNDAQIRQCFSSSVFASDVLYYWFENQYYKVRIIHNPDKLSLKCTKNFRLKLESGRIIEAFSINWDHKYGIIVDREAPSELIDHISELASASYWDWYFNFQIYNGDHVLYAEYQVGFYETLTTTYTLDTWFNFTDNLQ